MKSIVIETARLESGHLEALDRGECIAVRVSDFYPAKLCAEIAARMGASELYGRYANAPLIGRVGQAFFESLASEEHREAYEKHALEWISLMRTSCEPYLSPIDKLRLELDENWAGGARLGSIGGKKMFTGLARVFRAGAHAEPHQDVLAWDAPGVSEAESLRSQFAANIYLQLPDSGGELVVWPKSLDRQAYRAAQVPGSYGVDEAAIDCAPRVMVPKEGELILFNSNLLHAVKASHGKDRVTWSCFIGVEDATQPLMMWS